MRKTSIRIADLCAEAQKKFYYFEDTKTGRYYIMDHAGTIAIVTENPALLEALRSRKTVELTWRDINTCCERLLNREVHDSAEITRAMVNLSNGYLRVIKGTSSTGSNYAVCLDEHKLAAINPGAVQGVSAAGRCGSVILTCDDCYVAIMPVRYWRGKEDDNTKEAAMLALADAMKA